MSGIEHNTVAVFEAFGRAEMFSRSQAAAINAGLVGEEGAWFIEKLKELAETLKDMPGLYEQDGKGERAVVYLHYFKGAADWFITELTVQDDGTLLAFGLCDLGMGFPELGYVNIGEIVAAGVELDLHWEPRSLKDAREYHGAK